MCAHLFLTHDQLDQIIQHIESCLPEEGCGLIGGTGRQARVVIPVENELHSPVRFRMAPLSQLKAFDQIEAQGLVLLAIFHSHPQGPAGPSPTDTAEFFYPGTAAIIASPDDRKIIPDHPPGSFLWRKWRMSIFLMDQSTVHTVKLGVLD